MNSPNKKLNDAVKEAFIIYRNKVEYSPIYLKDKRENTILYMIGEKESEETKLQVTKLTSFEIDSLEELSIDRLDGCYRDAIYELMSNIIESK